jgi:hypothetical protein
LPHAYLRGFSPVKEVRSEPEDLPNGADVHLQMRILRERQEADPQSLRRVLPGYPPARKAPVKQWLQVGIHLTGATGVFRLEATERLPILLGGDES